MKNLALLLLIMLYFLCPNCLFAQKASLSEESRSLKTYPFSDPDPVPILVSNPKIYPYFKYEGYSHEGQAQDWKVVKLENEHVKVFVLPEVGGKVWGAIDKSTGNEFIYRNEVMKFRNISMRGPWTSGGIEFNFGIIGHHPSTATPVDYVLQEEDDGSVSCIVGNIDLPSRTQWRVKIKLPKDKAYFETEALWYNPTPMQQSYYNWMTAAAPARQDFEFFTPGDQYLKHSGEAMPWPNDALDRNLALYKDNNFGPSKSYHVVGEYNDFFGGYYHDANYGFGHWGEYEAIPGQKLWLWALSRSGGIWEDLLTDTDGQYIEFQAGRLFVQYFPGGHTNPITQANFEPYSTDQWREIWFPVKDIGGMKDVSEKAVMNVDLKDGQLSIKLNAFQDASGQIKIVCEGEEFYSKEVQFKAMENFETSIALGTKKQFDLRIDALDLHYTSQPEQNLIERSFESEQLPELLNSAEQWYRAALEDMKYRLFAEAKEKFLKVLEIDPSHLAAKVELGELFYRQGLYDEGLTYVRKALKMDTYHPQANYVAGILYRAKGDNVNAKEAFGWAARSMQYRSNAYAQMAEILLSETAFDKAIKYAQKALDFNWYNMSAWQVLAIEARKTNKTKEAQQFLKELLTIDPLHHFAYFERYLLEPSTENKDRFLDANVSELAYQTFLELAIDYYNKGLTKEATQVLELAPQHPVVDLWWSYLNKEQAQKYMENVSTLSANLVFPFRRETLPVLEWAVLHNSSWKLKYYLALNLWGKNREAEALDLMKSLNDTPDYAPFYLARAELLKTIDKTDPLNDLQLAVKCGAKLDWRSRRAKIAYHFDKNDKSQALKEAQAARTLFPDNYAVGMDYAKALNLNERYAECIQALHKLQVLPYEGASEGRRLYEQAHYGAALNQMAQNDYPAAIKTLKASKEWPENLGVGKPYRPDERIADYLLALCYQKLGKKDLMQQQYQLVAHYSSQKINQASLIHILGAKAHGESASEFLEQLLNSGHAAQPETQWVLARFTGNQNRLLDLKQYMTDHPNRVLLEKILSLE